MAVTFQCDECGFTAANVDGWIIVSVNFLHNDPTIPTPPGGRILDSTADDLLFHVAACRDAWCTQAGIPPPPKNPPG
jgi:hypothetical protein